MNNQIYPAMADVLTYVRGLKPRNKLGFAFGSCGWSGEGAKFIASEFEAMGLEQPCPMLQSRYKPSREELNAAFAAGGALAERLKERVAR